MGKNMSVSTGLDTTDLVLPNLTFPNLYYNKNVMLYNQNYYCLMILKTNNFFLSNMPFREFG